MLVGPAPWDQLLAAKGLPSLRDTSLLAFDPLRRPIALLRFAAAVALVAGLAIALSRLGIEWQWFSQFNAQAVALNRWSIQIVTFCLVMGLGGYLQWKLLQRSWRLRRVIDAKDLPPSPLVALRGWTLLLLYGALLFLLAGALTYLVIQAQDLIVAPFSGEVITGIPVLADLPAGLLLGLVAGLLAPLLLWPLTTLRLTLAVALAGSATALARGWSLWLPALMAVPFGESDPVTGLDLSFSVLQLPALRLLLSVVFAQGVVGLASCFWLTFTERSSLTDMVFPGLTRSQQQMLQPQLAVLAFVAAMSQCLTPFNLMVEGTGVSAGAGFVDLHVSVPLRLLLALLLLAIGLGLLLPMPAGWMRRKLLIPLGVAALGVPVLQAILAPLVQRLWVQPRELAVESPYLARSIKATRSAFAIDIMNYMTMRPKERLSAADLAKSPGTLANIRLWDTKPLLSTNRELQQLRLYYRFPTAAVDRYPLTADAATKGSQQVIIAAREFDTSALSKKSRSWLNTHMVYTHGYGFTVSPVNTAGDDGLPLYFIKDIGSSAKVLGIAKLGIDSASVRKGLPVGQPRIYFGTMRKPYMIAPSKVAEFDYPDAGLGAINSSLSVRSGIKLYNYFERLMAAIYLGEPRLLFLSSLSPDSILLIRQQVNQRLKALVPFLDFESQPYLVTAKVEHGDGYRRDQYQYWFLDGFTSSRSYPYSDPSSTGLRYLRNPVKAVVDAYSGRVWLYVSDPNDPILRTWQRIFPNLFRPLSAMPKSLLSHIQVPQTQFEIQAEKLLQYHVKNVKSFYDGDDAWSLPLEIYGSATVKLKPYHATLQLPGEGKPEFVLLVPFTPSKRANLVGWLAVRNDPPNYGQQLLVRFPRQRLVLGPQQVSALIEQDPAISYQFGLWDRDGSKVVHGNMLVLPVGDSLLYVEPIYLQSKNSELPTLVRVVVTDGHTFVMQRNLKDALQKLVQAGGNRVAAPIKDPTAP